MISLTLSCYLLALVSLPGLAVVVTNQKYRFLPASSKADSHQELSQYFVLSAGFSYAITALTIAVAIHQGLNTTEITYFFIGLVAASTVVVLSLIKETNWRETIKSLAPAVSIFLLTLIYQSTVGVYTEIPADIYAHLERFQNALDAQLYGDFGRERSIESLLNQGGKIWYHLIALLSRAADTNTLDTLASVVWISKSLFLTIIYYFSSWIFRDQGHRHLIACLSTAFVFLHFGINIFGFVRYYAFAPVILNLSIYFSAVILLVSLLQKTTIKNLALCSLPLITLTTAAAVVHNQEALYIITIAPLLLIAQLANSYSNHTNSFSNSNSNRTLLWVLVIITLIGFFAIYSYANQNWNRAPNIGWRLWIFHESDGWLPTISTLNLKHQFIRVITLWGLLVYFLFFLNIRRYINNIFIMAGMLSPLFTILNPFYVDLFLRIGNSTTLWRLCYLIPIHFVAADLAIHYAKSLKSSAVLVKSVKALTLALMVLLLLPIMNTWKGVHYSRFPTLLKIEQTDSHHHLQDAIDFLAKIKYKKTILTDPVTGYVVSGMTHHHSYRRKFFRDQYQEFTFDSYEDFPLSRYRGRLLMVNLRSNSWSENGELGRHWQGYILDNLKTFYPPKLIEHLQSNPDRFELLWEQDSIAIYKINN